VARLVFFVALLVGAFAALAGRWDWWAGWTFLALFTLYSVALFLWLARVDPDLARERRQDADARNAPYERVVVPLMVFLEIALLVVAVLDAGRFRLSTVPLLARGLGWACLALTAAVLPWVFYTNSFASGVGRIQEDRDHHVITGGPYRYLRHPMYAANIVAFLGLPLALGSWWALLPAVLLAALFVARTALEDRMLQARLPGYAAYAQHTPYRLVPGVW
jgi:protein-S-isoprenylcysteine O-methyltransferase Ste14